MPNIDWNIAMLAPLAALVVGSLTVLVIDFVLPLGRSRPWAFAAGLGAVFLAGWYVYADAAGAATAAFQVGGPGLTTVVGAYIGGGFTRLFQILILGAAALSLLLSVSWREMREEVDLQQDSSGYVSLLLLAAAGMAAMTAAGDLITMFVGLELLSLSLYVLVGFSRRDPRAREGAFKYFILGSVASGILLFGFALVFGETGSVVLAEIAAHWDDPAYGGALSGLAKVGIGLAIVGFAFKMALVPFHAWAPDAYQGAPTPVTAFMAVGTKVAAFAALFRFLTAAVPAGWLAPVLLPLALLAVLSMAVGSLGAMVQEDFKRLLAYSAIAHAGYLVLALSHRSEEAAVAGFMYLAGYAFTSLGAFAVLLWLTRGGREGGELSALAGLYYRKPWPAVALTVFLLSMAGMPPSGGFVGKLLLVLIGVRSGAWFLITGLVLTTGLSAYVYLRVIKTMFARPDAAEAPASYGEAAAEAAAAAEPVAAAEAAPWSWPLAAAVSAVIVICVAGTLQLGLAPQWVLSSIKGLFPLF